MGVVGGDNGTGGSGGDGRTGGKGEHLLLSFFEIFIHSVNLKMKCRLHIIQLRLLVSLAVGGHFTLQEKLMPETNWVKTINKRDVLDNLDHCESSESEGAHPPGGPSMCGIGWPPGSRAGGGPGTWGH